jgi:S1-C subfamily serine protease
MMHRGVLFFFVLIPVGGLCARSTNCATPALSSAWSAVLKRVAPAIVKVTAVLPHAVDYGTAWGVQKIGSGTAFFIDARGLLLTNYHVVKGASSVEITMSGSPATCTYSATVVATSPEYDLALLALSGQSKQRILARLKKIPVLTWESRPIVANEVLLCGYPLGVDRLTPHVGHIQGMDRVVEAQGPLARVAVRMTSQLSVLPGNSGGPVCNKAGRVVGICFGSDTTVASTGYLISSADAQKMVQQWVSPQQRAVGIPTNARCASGQQHASVKTSTMERHVEDVQIAFAQFINTYKALFTMLETVGSGLL